MKIMAISDIHGDEYKIRELEGKDYDILIIAGDLSIRGHNLKELLKQVRDLNKKTIFVPGNNDPVQSSYELCKEYGLIFLHKSTIQISNYTFAGIGGGLPTNRFYQPTTITEEEMSSFLSNLNQENLILISHVPPYNLGDTMFGTNIGSKSLLKFIEEKQPLYCICGHVHENGGKSVKIGKTTIINVAFSPKIINLQNNS